MTARPVAVPSPNGKFHRLRDLAEECRLSLRELYREVAEGSLIVHRFGRSLRVSEADKQAYIAARRCAPGNKDGRSAQRRHGDQARLLQNLKNSSSEDSAK